MAQRLDIKLFAILCAAVREKAMPVKTGLKTASEVKKSSIHGSHFS